MLPNMTFKSFSVTALITASLFNQVFAVDDSTISYQFVVSPDSQYASSEIYIAVVGYQDDGYAWMDIDNDFEINQMDSSDNTLSASDDDSYLYIDMFTPLSEIDSQTIPMPQLSSVRMYIAFGSPLYIRYDTLSDSGGYVAPTLNNEGDSNYGIRFEIIELTYNDYGLWTNTTRVDSYQYPMGLEVWGDDGFYKRVGEILTHDQITALWVSDMADTGFADLYTTDESSDYDIILNPSHHENFSDGGDYEDYFNDYVDAVWNRYSDENLCLSIGEAGKWVGKVNSSNQFVFTEYTDNYIDDTTGCNDVTISTDAMISAQPSTYEIMSASGVLAEDVDETTDTDNDLNIQKHFSAAFNRGVIDLSANYDEWISWNDSDDFFNNTTYGHNEYVEFWHNEDISFEGETYAFAYDDVFDYSSTIHTTDPEWVQVTIGGFSSDEYIEMISIELSCDSLDLTTGDTSELTVSVLPVNASNQSIVWETSDDDIVTVDEGEITAIEAGTATITASSYTEDISASCDITVEDEVDPNLITRIEAEDYTDMSGIQTETTSDEDAGENVGYIDTDDWMEYSIDIPTAGTYQIDFRLASPYDTGSFEVMTDDEVLATISVNNTGSFQTWETQSTTIEFDEGEQTLKINVTGDGWNFNWFEIYSTDDDNNTETNSTDYSSDSDDASSSNSSSGGATEFFSLISICLIAFVRKYYAKTKMNNNR